LFVNGQDKKYTDLSFGRLVWRGSRGATPNWLDLCFFLLMAKTDDRKYVLRTGAIALLTLLGNLCYVLCFLSHICIAGHMQHGPYSAGDWINDLLWATCFVAVGVFSAALHPKYRDPLIVASALLVASRFLLGSMGGGAVLVELVLLIVMNAYACAAFFRPAAFSAAESDHATGKRAQKTRLSFCLIGLAVLAALVLYFLP
jgi:hypothetical protein